MIQKFWMAEHVVRKQAPPSPCQSLLVPGLGATRGVRQRKGLYCRKERSAGGGPTGGREEMGSEATSMGQVRTREDLNNGRNDGISQSLGL